MKKVFLLQYCDAWKSHESMSWPYAFSDTTTGRAELWKHIKSEYDAGTINAYSIDGIKHDILKGDPRDANHFLEYAYISRLNVA